MDVDNLIDMANRIGEFFDSMPDHAEAVDSVADHIRRFWEPRMRLAILDRARRSGGERVDGADRARGAQSAQGGSAAEDGDRLTPGSTKPARQRLHRQGFS